MQSFFVMNCKTPKIDSNFGTDGLRRQFFKKIYMSRVSIFKKRAENLYLGGFWGEKSRGANGFWIWPHLTLTGPLVKIGGLRHIFESYLYRYDSMFYRFCNLSVTPFRQKIFSKLFLNSFKLEFPTWTWKKWSSKVRAEVGKWLIKLESFNLTWKESMMLKSYFRSWKV